ncbi:hypothetical protein ALO59_200015 [Pseudomonas amygdali pv. mellea]|nr:hypothetical protein ALO59_200015 [Pseudomonas amygdali pv. mellea]
MMDWHPLSTRKNLTSCPGSVDHYNPRPSVLRCRARLDNRSGTVRDSQGVGLLRALLPFTPSFVAYSCEPHNFTVLVDYVLL